MDLKEYVKSKGYKVTDLTDEQLREAQAECDVINAGGEIMDSVFDDPELIYKKMRKEAR